MQDSTRKRIARALAMLKGSRWRCHEGRTTICGGEKNDKSSKGGELFGKK
jgi:hypothetical protein